MIKKQGMKYTDPEKQPAAMINRPKDKSILRLTNSSILAPGDQLAVNKTLLSPWHYAPTARNLERHLNSTALNWHKDFSNLEQYPVHLKSTPDYCNAQTALAQRRIFLEGEFKRLDLDPPCKM